MTDSPQGGRDLSSVGVRLSSQTRHGAAMAVLTRWLSPSLFALVGIAFLLPFATVSCNEAETSFSGAQLVTRTVPAGGSVSDEGRTADIAEWVEERASGEATAALVAAVLGFALGLLGLQKGPGWCAAAGLVSMLLLGTHAFDPLGPDVSFHSGYWLALVSFAWAAALHCRRAWRRLRRKGAPSVASS